MKKLLKAWKVRNTMVVKVRMMLTATERGDRILLNLWVMTTTTPYPKKVAGRILAMAVTKAQKITIHKAIQVRMKKNDSK